MILFTGEEDKGFFIKESAAKRKEELLCMEFNPDISMQINMILATVCDFLIIDIEQYSNGVDDLAGKIQGIVRSKGEKTKVFIYAPGYHSKAKIIQELKRRGLVFFITAGDVAGAKEELEKCFNGFYEEEDLGAVEMSVEPDTFTEGKKIAITGACGRIGTTTQALQIVRYLQLNGYKVCYIEMNGNGYVEKLNDYFNTEHDSYIGKVEFDGIDLFYKQENLIEILKQEYDYYVYDFGTYTDTDFNKILFLEKDIRIFVVGSKANELPYTDNVLRNEYYQDVVFLFNFASEQEQKDILELMEDRADQTWFTGYAPDPFVLVKRSKEIFEEILPLKNVRAAKEKKRHGLFTRKKNRKK